MRILVLHSRYLSGALSGENRVVDDELRILREAGHDVVAWEPSVGPDASTLRLATDAVWSRTAAREVQIIVREHRPEIVHVHNLFPRLSPVVLRAVPSSTPTLMSLHNFRLMCLPATYLRDGKVCEACAGRVPWRGVLHACYRGSRGASGALGTSLALHRAIRTFERVDAFLAVSRFVRDKHVEAGFDPKRIHVKSNFSWSSERRVGPGGPVLFLGRIDHQKGLDVVLRALPQGLKLLVAGDGPERAGLEHGASPDTTFLGPVDPSGVYDLLRRARALAVPSRGHEGQPRVILEAFAVGVPVLASRIGGLPELVEHDVNGYLVEPDDARGWTEALERMSDDETSLRLGAGAYRTWERSYTPEIAIRELEDGYSAALAASRPSRRAWPSGPDGHGYPRADG